MALIKCPECENMVSDQAKTCIHCGTPINTKEESLLIAKLSKFNYKYPFFVKPFDVVGLFDENNNKILSFRLGQSQRMEITKPMKVKAYFMGINGKKSSFLGIDKKTCSNELTIVPGKTQRVQISVYDSAVIRRLAISFVDVIDSD